MVYEAVLKGFDGSGTKDHLIKWVDALAEEDVEEWCIKNGFDLDYIHETDIAPGSPGIDAVIEPMYRGHLIWTNSYGYYCALGGLQADTAEGIKWLIDKKIGGCDGI